MFTESGVTGVVRGEKGRLLAVGALSGSAVTIMPVAYFVVMALIFFVLQLTRGEELLHPMGGFMGNLKATALYLRGVWPYTLLMGVVFAFQTSLCRVALSRKKTFEIATGGTFHTDFLKIGYDSIFFAVIFVAVIPFALPKLGALLSYMGFFFYFSGAILYIAWASTFDFLMHRIGVLSRREKQLISLSEIFTGHDLLDGCIIEPGVGPEGTVAVLTGHVARKDQISVAVSACHMVEGIVDVDVSGLEIRRADHDKPFKHQRMC